MNADWGNPLLWSYVMLLIPFLLFAVLYGVRSPWRTTPAGRALMLLDSVLVLVLVRAVLVQIFGMDWPLYPLSTVMMVGSALVAGWYLVVTLVRLQNRGPVAQDRLERKRAKVTLERRELKAKRRQTREAAARSFTKGE